MERFHAAIGNIDTLKNVREIAVGVSGGPDSMALCWLLSEWAVSRGVIVHAITVDHGLRTESAEEAINVGVSLEGWPQVRHVILRWEGEKPETRILEEARFARYRLIRNYMIENDIAHLFTAHHQDDQVETFLTRLAKGSGLDGLAAMPRVQIQEGGIIVIRPLIDIPKEDIITVCAAEGIPYVLDPTNENTKYLRPRLRATRAALEEEGMSSKRIAVTTARLARARRALDTISEEVFQKTLREKDKKTISFDWSALKEMPEEIILRVLIRTAEHLRPDEEYGPRMERLEVLLTRLLKETGFKSATLGGCIFALIQKNTTLKIEREQA
jgi:tRNA(Ile)-lysidine synthase